MKGLGGELCLVFRPRMLRRLWRTLQSDDIPGIAAEVSFYVLLTLFPFLLLVGGALGLLVPQPEIALGRLFILLHRFLPSATATLLDQFLAGPVRADRPYLLSLGILGILWAASQGFAAVLKALTRVYCHRERRSWIRHRALSFGMMVLAALACVVVLVVMTGLDPNGVLARWIVMPPTVLVVWGWFRWGLMFTIVSLVLAWFYTVVPCPYDRRRWITPGGLIASLAWLGASAALAAYMDRVTSYSRMYGSVDEVIALLLWIYLGVFLMLMGAEINTRIVQRHPQRPMALAKIFRTERPSPRGAPIQARFTRGE